MLDIEKATKELGEKTLEEIEAMTAKTWGARAVASYRLAKKARTPADGFRRFYEGENFRQEAFEHAAMVDDGGELLREVRGQVKGPREESIKYVEGLVST